ncbi:MAG: FHA domain-containing protein [Sandaracinaceae bacterium]
MKSCKNCGAQNPDTSLYCQDCGARLGDWNPPEAPSRSATPPTGLSRADASQQRCPRCGFENAPHVRFCNNCGFSLKVADAPEAAAPPPATTPNQVPVTGTSAAAGGTVCWRCYGVGDPGAEFCKFCGARYADAPSGKSEPTPAAPPRADAPPSSRDRAEPKKAEAKESRGRDASGAPLSPPPESERPSGGSSGTSQRATLVSILKDGSDGRRYPLYDERVDIGRYEGQIILNDDPYLSPRHARIAFRSGSATLRDLDSVNGVFLRLREPCELTSGDTVLLGQQVLRFEVLAESELPLGPAMQHGAMVFGTPEVQRLARLVQYTTEGVGRDVHYLYRDETVIGREQGDIVFTDDPFMSRRHATITIDRANRRFMLRDLGSSNGTAVRFKGERALRAGDQFRVGRHLFRYEVG